VLLLRKSGQMNPQKYRKIPQGFLTRSLDSLSCQLSHRILFAHLLKIINGKNLKQAEGGSYFKRLMSKKKKPKPIY